MTGEINNSTKRIEVNFVMGHRVKLCGLLYKHVSTKALATAGGRSRDLVGIVVNMWTSPEKRES